MRVNVNNNLNLVCVILQLLTPYKTNLCIFDLQCWNILGLQIVLPEEGVERMVPPTTIAVLHVEVVQRDNHTKSKS